VVTPPAASVAKGRKPQYTATGTFSDLSTQDITNQVLWASSDLTVATISNAGGSQGLATTLGLGATTISAALTGVSGNTTLTVTDAVLDTITVSPLTATLVLAGKQQYTALGTFSDGATLDLTTTATWATGDVAIATISNAAASVGQATAVAYGTTAITATSTGIVGNATLVVAPVVTATLPRDTAFGIRASTPIVVTFGDTVAAATLTTQTAAGACSGSLQLSSDNFATCVAFTTAAPVVTGTTTQTATAQPTPALTASTTYKIRVLATVTTAGGVAYTAFTQPAGFATSAGGTCASGLVISQVYGGGGNGGALFRNDYIELHNGGATAVDLNGFAVQYASAAGTSWQVTTLPAVVVPAGGYFLIAENSNAAVGTPLAPDFTAPGTGIAMQVNNGKVALTASTTALSGACPLGLTNDFVGYGTATCSEGTGATAPLSAILGALRKSGGCTDADDNKNDFAVVTPAPRNGMTPLSVCGTTCPAPPAPEQSALVSYPDDGR